MTQENNLPFVSVVVISRDRHKMLEEAVESLLALDYPREKYEIVVVEEGDKPLPIPQTNYIFLPRRNLGLGYARNQGVRASKGEFIVFTDDDCLVKRDWLYQMIQPMLHNPEIFGVGGATLVRGNYLIGTCEAVLGFPGGGYRRFLRANGKIVETNLISGCNMAYRREVFSHLVFEERGLGRLGADDFLLSLEVAKRWKVIFNPRAIVYHLPRNNLKQIYKWFQRRRYCDLLYAEIHNRKFREIFSLRRGMVPRIILGILLIVGLKLFGVLLVSIGLLIIYGSLPLRYVKELRAANAKWGSYFIIPLVKATMDLSVLISDIKALLGWSHGESEILDEYNR